MAGTAAGTSTVTGAIQVSDNNTGIIMDLQQHQNNAGTVAKLRMGAR